MGRARVQATSRGGHGDKAHYNRRVLYGAKALTSNRMLPHCGRRTDVTGSEAVENKVSTTPRACGTTPRRFQCGPLAPLTAGCSVLRRPRNGKKLVPQPTQPWHQDHKKKGGGPGASVGWVGAPFFPGLGLEGHCIMQPAALKAHTETSSVWCRMRAGWWRPSLLPQAQ